MRCALARLSDEHAAAAKDAEAAAAKDKAATKSALEHRLAARKAKNKGERGARGESERRRR